MKPLSINLPDDIVIASSKAAKKLGFSRTTFIRQAIVHELEAFRLKQEQQKIINCFNAMKKSKKYLAEQEEIDNGFGSDLPTERDEWWNKKSY